MTDVRYLLSRTTKSQNKLIQTITNTTTLIEKLNSSQLTLNEEQEIDVEIAIHTLMEMRTKLEENMSNLMLRTSTLAKDESDEKKIDQKIEEVTNTIDIAEEKEITLKNLLLKRKKSTQQTNTRIKNETENNYSRLPPIPLPTFDGDRSQWKCFIKTFTNMVDRTSISTMEKFTYLMQSLHGEAKKVIQRFEMSEENYSLALQYLSKRYDNKKAMIGSLTKQLKEAGAQGQQLSCQREMYDTIYAITQQLKQQGENLDTRIVQDMIIQKFSREIQWKIFEEITKQEDDNDWNIDELLKNIEKTINHMERMETVIDYRQSHTMPKKETLNKTDNRYSSINLLKCVFCNGAHLNKECDLPVEAKREALRKSSGCWKCYKPHNTKDCRTNIKCTICNGNHTFRLCIQKEEPTTKKNFNHDRPEKEQRSFTRGKQNNFSRRPLTSENEVNHSTIKSMESTKTMNEDLIKKPPSGFIPSATTTAYNPRTNSWEKISVMFDTGADNTYCSRRLMEEWNLKKIGKTSITLQTFGEKIEKSKCDLVELQLKTQNGLETIKSLVSDKLVGSIRNPKLNKKDVEFLKTRNKEVIINHGQSVTPDIIIGTDYICSLWKGSITRLPSGLGVIDSELGPTTLGKRTVEVGDDYIPDCNNNMNTIETIEQTIEWEKPEKEAFQDPTYEFTGSTKEEKQQEAKFIWDEFNKSIEKREEGYFVRLPFRKEARDIPSNYAIAYKRLQSTLRGTKPEILSQIDNVFKEQLEKGIIENIDEEDDEKSDRIIHYNPHQAVITPHKTTTKCRVVVDGSSHFRNEQSLNDVLYQGPVILPDLKQLLIRLRSGANIIISDVEKAFLQVHIHEDDRDATRVLWLKDYKKPLSKENLQILRFRRVLFGLTCSPFLLGATILDHLNNDNDPLSKEISKNLYVDNLILTTDEKDHETLKELYQKIKTKFTSMKMNIREFQSNNDKLREHFDENDKSSEEDIKILGLLWKSKSDDLEIKFDVSLPKVWTKRNISSIIGSIYDPCGFLVPLTLTLKLEHQKTWKEGFDWDDKLPPKMCDTWQKLLSERNGFTKNIRREVIDKSGTNSIITFTDASNHASAACSYIVNRLGSNLIHAKSTIRPAQERWTIPKLELLGVIKGIETTSTAVQALKDANIHVDKVIILTDSEIVKAWIKQPPSKDKGGVFVTNRLREIRRNVEIMINTGIKVMFGYIRTNENPADHATRGFTRHELLDCEKWWHGPKFITTDIEKWPEDSKLFEIKETENIINVNSAHHYCPDQEDCVFNYYRTNDMDKMIRIAAYTQKFIKRVMKTLPQESQERITKTIPTLKNAIISSQDITAEEMDSAETLVIKDVQKTITKKQLEKWSNLNLKIDKDGLVRCHGRIERRLSSIENMIRDAEQKSRRRESPRTSRNRSNSRNSTEKTRESSRSPPRHVYRYLSRGEKDVGQSCSFCGKEHYSDRCGNYTQSENRQRWIN